MHIYSSTLFKFPQCFFCYCHQTENEIQIVSVACGFLFYIKRTTGKIKSYLGFYKIFYVLRFNINPFKPELNSICYLLALLGAHNFLHVSRIRVKSLTLRLLMSHIYGSPILDVSRSHTTTQHSR